MTAINNGEPIPGGIANGIIGTLIMLAIASAAAIPLGVLCGTCLAEKRHSWYAHVVSYMTDLLQGTPSIIIGIVVYVWAVVPFHGYSAMAGSVALCIMMLPLIVGQWKFSGDKHKSLQVYIERIFHQRYPLVML